jgi:hypothetical protein
MVALSGRQAAMASAAKRKVDGALADRVKGLLSAVPAAWT